MFDVYACSLMGISSDGYLIGKGTRPQKDLFISFPKKVFGALNTFFCFHTSGNSVKPTSPAIDSITKAGNRSKKHSFFCRIADYLNNGLIFVQTKLTLSTTRTALPSARADVIITPSSAPGMCHHRESVLFG